MLERAVDLFWRSGYRSTTTRDLEAALGISQSSLYNAFGSKRGLMGAAMERYESRVGETLLGPLESSSGELVEIHQFFDKLVETITATDRQGCMIINLMAEDDSVDSPLTERITAYRDRIRAALRTSLQRGVESGTIEPGRLDERADLLFAVILGLNVLAKGGASHGEVERLAAGIHALVDGWQT